MKLNKKAFTLIELIIVGTILFLFTYNLPPAHVYRTGDSERQKRCFTNIRIIQEAVAIYNLDVKEENIMKELDIEQLIKGGYLKEDFRKSKPEEACSYISEGDLSKNGVVACEYHGTL